MTNFGNYLVYENVDELSFSITFNDGIMSMFYHYSKKDYKEYGKEYNDFLYVDIIDSYNDMKKLNPDRYNRRMLIRNKKIEKIKWMK